jgi:hypothetical protein
MQAFIDPRWPMLISGPWQFPKPACYLHNHVPSSSTGLSPTDLFTKTQWQQWKFHDLHVRGCPIYVLDKALQDGKKIPQWKPRSQRSIYMGVSSKHASCVPLVLNFATGSITPQFHIVFDNWFATVSSESDDIPNFSSDEWAKMFGDSSFQYVLDDLEEVGASSDLQETTLSSQKSDVISSQQETSSPAKPLSVKEPATATHPISRYNAEGGVSSHSSHSPSLTRSKVSTSTLNQMAPEDLSSQTPSITSPNASRASSPERKPPKVNPSVSQPWQSSNASKQVSHLTYSHDKRSLTHEPPADISLAAIDSYYQVPTIHICYDAKVLLTSKSQSNPYMFNYTRAMNGDN